MTHNAETGLERAFHDDMERCATRFPGIRSGVSGGIAIVHGDCHCFGRPSLKGIITGIVGGLVVGFLAGCPLQVSGPAAGLNVIVFDVIQRFGLGNLGIVLVVAGGIQVLAGFLQLGQWF
ncbi:MAG: hypothetical protein NPIRA06_11360 [Nitrospirales bacterium]|nr:MAG: hypothetical protein NPIRA06_11360 [Nitrospirales bacterium]